MGSLTEKIKEMEKKEILSALKECKWVMSKAARKLGITERMIGYKMKKHQIKREMTYIGDGFESNR
jgi:transcriptional regulator with GAF, ATPase, and Fis domain